jgi:hypothetical protein
MPPDDTLTIPQSLSDLALVALEQGVASRQLGAEFAPFVLIEFAGHCYVRRCEREDAIGEAAEFLSREPDSTAAYALAYDGSVTVEGTEFDAILVIAGETGGDAFVFTQRYDAASLSLIGDPALIGQHESLMSKAS